MEKNKAPKVYSDVIAINVDVQNDFALPTGALSVAGGEEVIEPLNNLNRWVRENGGQVLFTRDWHPKDTAHFNTHGGPWPPHCIRNRAGAAFHDNLEIMSGDNIADKGDDIVDDGYSGWYAEIVEGDLMGAGATTWNYPDLPDKGIYTACRALNEPELWHDEIEYKQIPADPAKRKKIAIVIGGLATDFCVKETVLDALDPTQPHGYGYRTLADPSERKYDVYLATDAIRAVNLRPDDGDKAIAAMKESGAIAMTTEEIINGGIIIDTNRLER